MIYKAPASVSEAVALLQDTHSRGQILAGGTDLLVQMQAGLLAPALIIDIKNIAATRQIEQTAEGYRVGAAVTGAELNEHTGFVQEWPGVAEAFDLIGSTQIQGRATLGGNLCNGSPAADSVPALIAAACSCRIAGPGGERRAAVEDLIDVPGRTRLEPGEFIVDFEFPQRKGRYGDAYLRLIPRTEMDIAVVGAGASLVLDEDERCLSARITLGAVAPQVLLVEEAARAIIGSRLEGESLAAVAKAASEAARPISDKRGTAAYRSKVAGVLARRSTVAAFERAIGRKP